MPNHHQRRPTSFYFLFYLRCFERKDRGEKVPVPVTLERVIQRLRRPSVGYLHPHLYRMIFYRTRAVRYEPDLHPLD